MFELLSTPATFDIPSPKFQENAYGVVPPEAFAVKLTAVPAVPVVGGVVNETASVKGEIVIVAVAVACFAFALVALTLTVYVPFSSYVWGCVSGLVVPPATFADPSPKLQE